MHEVFGACAPRRLRLRDTHGRMRDMRTGSRICYTCEHCELRENPPKRAGRKGLGICRLRKRIVDIRADACEGYERKEKRC